MARTAKITNANVGPLKNKGGSVGNTPVRAQDFNVLVGDHISQSDATAQSIASSLTIGDAATDAHTINGTISATGLVHMGYVDNTTAFVQNDNSNVTWVQPAGTILKNIYLFVALQPTLTVNAATDCGFLVGTAAEGEQLVAHQTDTLIDAAANTTALKTGAFVHVATRDIGDLGISGPTVRLLPVPEDTDLTVLIADQNYTAAARTLYFGTSTTNQVVGAPGTVRWLIEYIQVA
tara:strand:+ start:702 stop:1406 length:705 start_codon:yes stop_codon:yes gene_type:complete